MKKTKVIIQFPSGLHARPASQFIRLIKHFHSEIQIRKGRIKVNGKSILGILTLGAALNAQLEIQVSGDDEDRALNVVETFFNAMDATQAETGLEESIVQDKKM